MRRIAVVGGGPAGLTFALKLALESNSQVELYCKNYGKACGEVVPEDALKIMLVDPVVLNEISKHELRIEGSLKYCIDNAAKWLVIDKKRWIKDMKREAVRHGVKVIEAWANLKEVSREGYDVIVDARGPLSSNGFTKIVVGRVIVDCRVDCKAILDFYPSRIGFAWIFPWGSKANLGAGFLSIRNPGSFIKLYTLELLPKCHIIDERYSLITIGYPSKNTFYAGNRVIRVGEASGFIYPLTGEGIRPSIMHALEVADALAKGIDLSELWNYISHGALGLVIKEIRKQYRILHAISRIKPVERITCMNYLSKRFYENLMKGYVNLSSGIMDVLLNNPVLVFKLLTNILF